MKNKVKRKITNILLIILLIIIIISLSSGDNTPFSSGELKNGESVEVPGFGAVFTVIPILAVVCLFSRKRDSREKDGNKNENENDERGHR